MPLPDGVELILAPNPSLLAGPGTNSYLVSDTTGESVVIDPGPDITEHLARIADMAHTRGRLAAILITHGHPDHVEGAAHLRELTSAPVLAWSRKGSPAADQILTDGATIAVGNRVLRALHTPGHRFDHLCFLLEDAATVFAGDLVAGSGTVVIAPPEGDLLDYLTSLRSLRALDLRQILPAHGPSVDDPNALLDYYIQHRMEREEQVIAGLRAGPTTIPALVAKIYAGIDPQLHPVAALSVEAHLLKLQREGRAAREDRSGADSIWRLTE
ncbi:MAG TPA: MBL fold metallo-hydrolase [Ktedonobacterales bacterium]|jgi:glyoxylase-like metal-dependent hydrolase (beta-lactamase superfamily II)|nr:MBL fold metallo-hydrolase [Ktedonobacterales bacterium]